MEKDKVLIDELGALAKKTNTYKQYERIREAIFQNAEGVDLPVNQREKLKYSESPGDEFEYKKNRMRVFSFMDDDAEVIANGIPNKRDEEYKKELAKMRKIKVEYFNLKGIGELLTINEEGKLVI